MQAEGVEAQLVAAMLACAESLELPADALAKLQENTSTLALAIAPHVSAVRNAAYATGFAAHGSRAADAA